MSGTLARIADKNGPQFVADSGFMVETSARLLRLLTLLEVRPDWPGADLAARLGVTPRTLRRDVQKLRGLGYPVSAAPGVAGGYRLGAGAALPPLLLDDDEAIAVALSLRTAASHAVTGVAEASLRALAKLEQVLPARLRERAIAIGQATVPLAAPQAMVDAEDLTTIARACRSREQLTFAYQTRDGSQSTRRAQPYRLVQAGNRWYLVARDVDRADWRTFRLDRISAPQPTGIRFVLTEPPDAAKFVASAISTAPYRYHARVRLHAALPVIAAQLPPTVGTLEAAGGDACLLTTGHDSLRALIYHLSQLDCDFTVLEPPELIEQLRAVATRLQRAAPQEPQQD
jgi:predicted DNA-binding transcriptional regulator YafY